MLKNFLKNIAAIRKDPQYQGLWAVIIKGTLGVGSLKLIQMGLTVAIGVALARALGPKDYGTYVFALTLATVVMQPMQLPLNTLLMRKIAEYHAVFEWARVKGILVRAFQVSIFFSLLVVLLGFIFGAAGYDAANASKSNVLFLAFLLAPLVAFASLLASISRGLRRITLGQLPETLQSLMFLIFLVTIPIIGLDLNVSNAYLFHIMSVALAIFIVGWLLAQMTELDLNKISAVYDDSQWIKSFLPLLVSSSVFILNSQVDLLLLGLLRSSEDVGIYRVATQIILLVAAPLVILNSVIPPYVSRLFYQNDMKSLQKLIIISSRVVFATSLLIGVTLILFDDWLLAGMFGPEFIGAATAITILCVGQLVNALMGPVTMVLNMTGNERDTAVGMIVAIVSNIALSLYFIPLLGIKGAAIANCSSLCIWNVFLFYRLNRVTGLNSCAIPLPSFLLASSTKH